MVETFKNRHDYLVRELNSVPGVQCLEGDGTFYCFARIQDHSGKNKIMNDVQLAEHLINAAGVALVPGSAFGAEGYLRFSFATSMETLQKAVIRLKLALSHP